MMAVIDRCIVMLMQRRSKIGRYTGWYSLVCIGRRRHYRKAGGCKHVDQILSVVRPEKLRRIRVDGWGGKPPEPAR